MCRLCCTYTFGIAKIGRTTLPVCQPANDEDEDEENADNEVDINMTIYLLKWFIFFF